MTQCEICGEVYGINTPCESCSLGNPCLRCEDYQNNECISNGGCGFDIKSISGRPLYYLYKNKNCYIYTGRLSQQDFITILEEVLKREKIVGERE